MLPRNRQLKHPARELRKNMTDAEKLLWSRIRRKQLKNAQFYRQKVIGDYIVDFFCYQLKLVIEVDGSQHSAPEDRRIDDNRDEYLNNLGLTVLRFSNNDVLNEIDNVVEKIWDRLESP